MSFVRELRVEDLPAVKTLVDSLPMHKPWMRHISSEAVLDAVINGDVSSAVLCEKYLFIYDVNPAWLSYEPILTELSLIVMYPNSTGTFEEAIQGMLEIAKTHNAVGISVGTSIAANDEALARLYEGQGFNRIAIDLYKEIT